MMSLWRHTWDVVSYFGTYGKRRPLAILWYKLHESGASFSSSQYHPHPAWEDVFKKTKNKNKNKNKTKNKNKNKNKTKNKNKKGLVRRRLSHVEAFALITRVLQKCTKNVITIKGQGIQVAFFLHRGNQRYINAVICWVPSALFIPFWWLSEEMSGMLRPARDSASRSNVHTILRDPAKNPDGLYIRCLG